MSDNKITIPLTLTITNWNQDAANEIARINNIDLTGCKNIEEQLNLLSNVLSLNLWYQFVCITDIYTGDKNEEIILCNTEVTIKSTGKSFPTIGII